MNLTTSELFGFILSILSVIILTVYTIYTDFISAQNSKKGYDERQYIVTRQIHTQTLYISIIMLITATICNIYFGDILFSLRQWNLFIILIAFTIDDILLTWKDADFTRKESKYRLPIILGCYCIALGAMIFVFSVQKSTYGFYYDNHLTFNFLLLITCFMLLIISINKTIKYVVEQGSKGKVCHEES